MRGVPHRDIADEVARSALLPAENKSEVRRDAGRRRRYGQDEVDLVADVPRARWRELQQDNARVVRAVGRLSTELGNKARPVRLFCRFRYGLAEKFGGRRRPREAIGARVGHERARKSWVEGARLGAEENHAAVQRLDAPWRATGLDEAGVDHSATAVHEAQQDLGRALGTSPFRLGGRRRADDQGGNYTGRAGPKHYAVPGVISSL